MAGQSHPELQRIIARAALNESFCQGLLDGDRPHLLEQFDLSDQERAALSDIQACDFESLAQEIMSRIAEDIAALDLALKPIRILGNHVVDVRLGNVLLPTSPEHPDSPGWAP